jgi:hypothetical protein
VQRLSAVLTLVIALLVVVVASAQPSEPARRAASPAREFDRHPRVTRADKQLLARAGGWLWWVDGDCNASAINLATLRVRHVEGQHCRVWPNPQGTLALAPIGGSADLVAERRLAVIDLNDPRGLRQVATIHHQDGVLASPVAWDAGGDNAAFCIASPAGTEVIRVTAYEWEQRVIPDACDPVWLGGDRLAFVRDDRVVDARGRALPLRELLLRTLRGGHAKITALAANRSRPELVAIGVARRTQYGRAVPPAAMVVADLRGIGVSYRRGDSAAVRETGIAPDGRAAWFVDVETGRSHLEAGPLPPAFPGSVPIEAWRYAWSDGGAFLAVAEDHRVEVFDWRTGQSAVVDNISARDLAWVR